LNKIDTPVDKLSTFLTEDVHDKLDIKIIEGLFNILYKKELISKKEFNLLIAHLNHKLQEFSE